MNSSIFLMTVNKSIFFHKYYEVNFIIFLIFNTKIYFILINAHLNIQF